MKSYNGQSRLREAATHSNGGAALPGIWPDAHAGRVTEAATAARPPLKMEQARRVYRTRFMGGLNEPNVPDALRALRRKRRASIAFTRQSALRAHARRHDLQSVLQ